MWLHPRGRAGRPPEGVGRAGRTLRGDGGGGEGGSGGCGGGEGGEGGGWNCTTKDVDPSEPSAKEKLCPKPGASHTFPVQPSPYQSVMYRVHVAPSAAANGKLEVNGAPPSSVVPSEQARLQPTSSG